MPVAAVQEDGDLAGDKCDVRSAGNLFVVKAVAAKACMPKCFTKGDLGLGILGAVGAHDARNSFTFWRG